MIRYSKSGFSINASKTRCQTPFLAHRRKRWNTLFQLPKSSGRSRHGALERAIQSTASTNRRLSSPCRPLSPSLPGTSCSMRRHCALVSSRRIKIVLLSFDLESHSRVEGIPYMSTQPSVRRDNLRSDRAPNHVPSGVASDGHEPKPVIMDDVRARGCLAKPTSESRRIAQRSEHHSPMESAGRCSHVQKHRLGLHPAQRPRAAQPQRRHPLARRRVAVLCMMARHAQDRGGPGCLNRFSASISGASAGVRLPSGVAAG